MTPWLVVFAPLVIAYVPALWWCWQLWWVDESYFAHGPLVPIVMGIVIWGRRAQWSLQPAMLDRGGLWLLVPALLLHLVGAALTIDSLSAASLALAVPGAAWLALGRQRLQGLWPALWLFALAIPLPIYVTGQLAFELKEIAVRGGVALAQLTGLAVVRDGARLHVPGQEAFLDVADPCGGLRSLLAMIALAYCFAFFLGPPQVWRRVVLLVLAAPIALVVNLLRIAAICWCARWWGVPFATGVGHDLTNGVAWVVDLALIFGIDSLCTGRTVALPEAPPPTEPAVSTLPAVRPWPVAAVLWLAAMLLLWLSIYRPYVESSGRARSLPAVVGHFRMGYDMPPDDPMTRRFHALLGTDDVAWRTYRDRDDEPAFVVAVFHGTNWKSVHPPRICLLGSNMEILTDGDTELGAAGGARIGRILLKTRKDNRPYLSLYAYGARGLLTGSYFGFFMHHAPRALFRQSNDGFLLRVEAFADGAGGMAAAEQRCRDLLVQLLEEAQSRLP